MEAKDSEYNFTRERVEFGMMHKPHPDRTLREKLNSRLKECGNFPYSPMKVPVDEMTKILYDHPNLNKIHSISLDAKA